MSRYLACLVACVLCSWASGGTIYKCTEGSSVSYGDRPCRGAGSTLNVPSAPAQVPDARSLHARNLAMLKGIEGAKQAEIERTAAQREHTQRTQRTQRAQLAQRKRCDKLRLQRQWAIEDAGRQRGDAREAARLKTRRQAEALALECPA